MSIDIAILSDTYSSKHEGVWHQSSDGGAAIWSCGKNPIQLTHRMTHRWFVRARANNVYIYSCYLPPRVQIQEFQAVLEDIIQDAQDKSPIIIAGDFNAWSTDWGSKRNNPRGLILADTLAHLNACLLNNGSKSTYSMGGRESIIDLTFASPELARNAAWHVSDTYTHSDHHAVITEIRARAAIRRPQPARHVGYKADTMDRATLLSTVQTIRATGDANNCAQDIADCIKTACEASMARRFSGGSRRSPVPWWNAEIAKARADCCTAKRRLQRSRGSPMFNDNLADFRTKRKTRRNAIKGSKTRCFQELCDAADAEPFGAAYKMVMSKLYKQPMPTCASKLKSIVKHLFPQQPPLDTPSNLSGTDDAVVQTTLSEVLEITAKIKSGKAPGPDGIPNAALKAIIAAHPDVFVDMFNKCLMERTIPNRWKKQKLVLIPKPGKELEDPSSYRPLCMLGSTGKILEKIICNRLEREIENRRGLSEHQYGFRKHRSTTDAIGQLIDTASRAIEGARAQKQYCLVCTLDVKNAFI